MDDSVWYAPMRSPCYVKHFYLLVEKPKLIAFKTTSAQHREQGAQGRIYTFKRPVKLSCQLEAPFRPQDQSKNCSFGLLMPVFTLLWRTNRTASEHLVRFLSHYNTDEVLIVALISILQMNKLRLELAQGFTQSKQKTQDVNLGVPGFQV